MTTFCLLVALEPVASLCQQIFLYPQLHHYDIRKVEAIGLEISVNGVLPSLAQDL